eukprot:gene7593-8393_t
MDDGLPKEPLPDIIDWGLIPTVLCCRKVFIVMLRRDLVVQEEGGLFKFFLYRCPLLKVEVVGVVRCVERRAKRVVVVLDDGTASIRCTKHVKEDSPYDTCCLTLGMLAQVRGSVELSETNSDCYGVAISAHSIDPCLDPNMEALHWLRVLQLNSKV